MNKHRSISPPLHRQSSESANAHHSSDNIPLQHYRLAPKAMSDRSDPAYSSLASDSKELTTQHTRMQRLQRFGWWWEFGAVFVAITSTAAIIAVLLKVDDKPLAGWPWSIQPASLVAVFSTIAKGALLVPVAVCISQLKWSYFEKPRELAHMQAFDDASRGPWGALVFLWKTRAWVHLAGLGATITVCMMAFEPFSQQAIHFSERTLRLYNETAWIGFTNEWSDLRSAYGAIIVPPAQTKLNFTISMMETFIGRPSTYKSSLSCPSGYCSFGDFTSLGVHSVCEKPEAFQMNNEFGCTYYTAFNTSDSRQNYTQLQSFKEAVERDKGRNLTTYGMDCSRPKEGFPTFTIDLNVNSSSGVYTLEPITTQSKGTSLSNPNPTTQSNEGLFGVSNGFRQQSGEYVGINTYGRRIIARFCISNFNRIYGGNSPTNGTFDTIGTFTCFDRSYNPNITDLDTFGQSEATLTHCRVSLCAQEFRNVTVSNNTLGIDSLDEVALQKSGDGPYGEAVATSVKDSSKHFILGPKAITPMVDLVKTVLYSNDFAEFIAFRQNYTDWRDVFTPLASSMSDFMRSPSMSDYTRQLRGKVYVSQAFFDVTWGWIVMPLLMVALSTGFLVVTVVCNRNKPYLFKTSVLATMRYGVEGWDKETLGRKRVTDVDLDRAASGVTARLISGQDKLSFVKQRD